MVDEPWLKPHVVELGGDLSQLTQPRDCPGIYIGTGGDSVARVLRRWVLMPYDSFGDALCLSLGSAKANQIVQGYEAAVKLKRQMGTGTILCGGSKIMIQAR